MQIVSKNVTKRIPKKEINSIIVEQLHNEAEI